VTVASLPPAPLAIDDCNRSSSATWGSAPTGGAYALGAPLSPYSVSGGACRITLAGASAARSARLSVAGRDLDLAATIATDKTPTGFGQMAALIARSVAPGKEYRARVRFAPNGSVLVAATLLSGGVGETVLGEVAVPGLAHAPGRAFRVRAQVVGAAPTTIRIKVWAAGTPEPAAWHLTLTNSTAALQAAGAVGLNAYLSSSTANGPVGFAFDDLEARTL
jgi:hypothetical protein